MLIKHGTGKYLVIGSMISVMALVATSGAKAAEQLRLVITETTTPLVPNSVQELAQTLGYYERAGVDVEIIRVQQTPSAIAALTSGDGDMANVSFSAALQLIARNKFAIKAVASPDKAIPFIIAAKKSVATPIDLVGRTFGVGRIGSLDHSLSTTVLSDLGVDVDAIDLVALGQPSVRATALAAGRVDATTMSVGVWSALTDKDDLHVLVAQADYYAAAPLLSKVNIVTEAFARDHPEAIAAFVRGIVLASRDFASNSDIWVAAMEKARPDVSRTVLEELASAYSKNWSTNGGINLADVAYTTGRAYETADFDGLERIDPSSWIDTGHIDAVLTELGVDGGMDDLGR